MLEENSFWRVLIWRVLIWRVLIWRVLIWRVPSNFGKERSRIGWELNVPVAWWPVKEPGVMLPEPCNSARVRDGTVSAPSNCVPVGCSSE